MGILSKEELQSIVDEPGLDPELKKGMLEALDDAGISRVEPIEFDGPAAVKRHERWFGKQSRLISRPSVPIKERIAGISMQFMYRWDNAKESALEFIRANKASFTRRHVRASAWLIWAFVYPVAVQKHLLRHRGDDLPDGREALRSMLQNAFAEEGYDPHGDIGVIPADDAQSSYYKTEDKPGKWDRIFNGVIVK